MPVPNPFAARASLGPGLPDYYRIDALAGSVELGTPLEKLPFTMRILLENVIRNVGRGIVRDEDVRALAAWKPGAKADVEIPYLPARVVLQDFTGVPAVVDLAVMRDAMAELGGDPARVNPLVPADLVIDHSVQIDAWASQDALEKNVAREYERNTERYQLLRWAQGAFDGFRAVPPGNGIVHQVNLEHLAPVVQVAEDEDGTVAYPDTLVGTDSHTTMINGLGVLGYGVGGIEAEAVLLGQPLYQQLPTVVGVRLRGELAQHCTATDLVLTVTEMLRKHGVVGKFVEVFGDGMAHLPLADRATIANMSPEFGATSTLFPIDDETLAYLRLTGRDDALVALVETYAKANGLWRLPGAEPVFDELLELDLATVVPSLAGPRRPQDRLPLSGTRANFRAAYPDALPAAADADDESRLADEGDPAAAQHDGAVAIDLGESTPSILRNASVVIAAITSCTNTSNPAVMLGAGLLAKKAVARGLTVSPTVKTSLAPGSRAVTEYLRQADVLDSLAALGFDVAGYGCTTCIGNSGPLDERVASAIEEHSLVVASVLSGNRNFEGRIHALARASYLASPPLVVAFAIAGTVDIDLESEPLGFDRDGKAVMLSEIWPSADEVRSVLATAIDGNLFRRTYASVFEGDERWKALPIPEGNRYVWEADSTYIAKPPLFDGISFDPAPVGDITGARVLALLGDSVTTDHISPAGSIAPWSPAGQWLQERGVAVRDFNSYGSRRGHHEVMIRGTFANIRLRNALAGGKEGPYTTHQPSGELQFIYDAAQQYAAEQTPLMVIAGREYGTGSSRDWAAKGTMLLGVRAVLAESFERIHRSNLVGMGVLPLQFLPGQNATSIGLTGRESFTIEGLEGGPEPRSRARITATSDEAGVAPIVFEALIRLDGSIEVDYYRQGGILPAVLRRLAREDAAAKASSN